jgi:hypothetical protein
MKPSTVSLINYGIIGAGTILIANFSDMPDNLSDVSLKKWIILGLTVAVGVAKDIKAVRNRDFANETNGKENGK